MSDSTPAVPVRTTVEEETRPVILIVDDEPYNIDLLEQELEGHQLEIHSAANGKEALAVVAERPPDMIFLDLMMPILDGFGVLEALQSHPDWREIPVVIVSASGDLENIVRGIEMGATDFLPKPFEPAILQARLDAGLEKKRLRDLEQRYFKSLERELEIGREIQAGFLPTYIPQPTGWEIKAHFQAAREVAGDFYDVFEITGGQIGFLLGDVTDKGVGSALYMALYRSLLRVAMLSDTFADDPEVTECMTPEDCLSRAVRLVNHYICRFHESALFATLFFGILNTDSGRICYINAGHDQPYWIRGGSILEQIEPTGPVVGAIQDATYKVETFVLEPGDSLFVYSDGIPDAQDRSGDMFSHTRLRKVLEGSDQSPDMICERLLIALEEHMNQAAQFDDITLLMLGRL